MLQVSVVTEFESGHIAFKALARLMKRFLFEALPPLGQLRFDIHDHAMRGHSVFLRCNHGFLL